MTRAGAEQPGDRQRKRAWARWRDRLRDRPAVDFTYRIVVGVIGGAVLTVGIIAIPYPGPGWAIVFLGLAILATEFEWARHALKWTKHRYDRVMDWFARQGLWVRVLGAVFTCAIVLATVWLLGALAWSGRLVGIEWEWLKSPLGIGG